MGVLSFEDVLLPTEMEIDYDLAVEVLFKLKPDLVGHVDLISNRPVSGLESIDGLSVANILFWRQEEF